MIKAEWTNKDSLDLQPTCNQLATNLQPTCNQLATTEGDLINRADAIKCIRWGEGVTDVIGRIKALPSAEPKTKCIAQIRIDRDDIEDLVNEKVNEIVDRMAEPKTGEWIYAKEQLEIVPMWGCSCCKIRMPKKFNYCPNCGTRMTPYKGGEDE